MLPKLERFRGPPAVATESERAVLMRTVFAALDVDGDQRLSESEMLVFARETGFDLTAADWSAEFQAICEESGETVAAGITMNGFAKLIDDQLDKGCFCTTEELKVMTRQLSTTSAAPPQARAPPREESLAADAPRLAHRFYIKQEDIAVVGHAEGCPRCDHERRYGPGRTSKPHWDVC